MKLIPCQKCRARFIGPETASHPRGAPVLFGYWSGGQQLVVRCFRCGDSFKMTAGQFNQLPSLTERELKGVGQGAPGVVGSA